ncbi:MAG: LuxR family transcriptional regulator [Colwellia sp.]|nr:LuxR family transcriptional regulator [Colwellia sp.]
MIKNCLFIYFIAFFSLTTFAVNASSEKNETINKLTIYVPGSVSGGYDHTATAIRNVLINAGFVKNVEIIHLVGAGGVIALTHFINNDFSEKFALLLGGRSMIGAALYNNASVSLLQTEPLARLVGKPLAIAVAQNSPIENINDLLDAMTTDLSAIKWIGGSAGATDNVFIKDLLLEMNLKIDELNYHPVPGGGKLIAKQLITGNYTAAISTLDEFSHSSKVKDIRVIALTSKKPIAGIATPTIIASGVDASLMDWHGLFISTKTDIQKKNSLIALFKQLANHPQWKREIKANHWQDIYIEGKDFYNFVNGEQQVLANKFIPAKFKSSTKQSFNKKTKNLLRNPYRWAGYIAILCLILVITLFVLRLENKNREDQLQINLTRVEEENRINKEKLDEKLNSLSQHIEQEFVKWGLTPTEKEIALMLLKGLTFKEIAEVRCKSERTVRQQAGAIYAKSSLSNRSDLSAYFLEDFMTP